MTYCINPRCTQRSNPESATHCLGCGMPLTINGSYRLQQFLRSPDPSHSTEVFVVLDAWNGNKKKVLKSLVNSDPLLLDLFRREKKLLTNFDHSGIPKGEDFFQVLVPTTGQELSCIVMEWIEGVDLQHWIQENDAISQDKALDWLQQITEILAYIHERHVFHRDIKPSNLMLRPNGTLVLIDFGAIKQATQAIVNGHSLTVVSSHGYTAPEQLQANAVLQSDFFALGRTFIHLLTGQHPCDLLGDKKRWSQSIRSPISDDLVDLINDLTNELPSHRPQNAQVLLRRIEAISNASPLATLIKKAPQRHWHPNWLLWLVPCLVGLGFAIVVWNQNKRAALSPACDVTAGDFLSCGEEFLDPRYTNQYQLAGTEAWKEALNSESKTQAAALYTKAAENFAQSLGKEPNNPETRIYFNNARIQAEAPQSRTIAVVVPLKGVPGDSASRGLEILRGVAQAQQEAYQQGFKLKILIGDDRNLEGSGKAVAHALINKDIPAVLGHYASDLTQPTIPIYQSRNLVLISPTSTAESLAKQSNQPNHVFFRTSPSNTSEARALSNFLYSKQQIKTAVFLSRNSVYSKTLADGFTRDFQDGGAHAIQMNAFDLSKSDFNVGAAIAQVQKQGATAIAVFPDGLTSTYSFHNAIAIMQANQGKRWVVSGNSLLDAKTLDRMTLGIAKRLVIVAFWNLQSAQYKTFMRTSTQMWGEEVTHRSALAYDAMQVLLTAFRSSPKLDRVVLQKALSADTFKAEGATGTISFEGSDRKEQFRVLLKVISKPNCGDHYVFTPLFDTPAGDAKDCKGK